MPTLAILALAAATLSAPPAPASPRLVAVRDGVVAIPLRTPEDGIGLPAKVAIVIEEGKAQREVIGTVVWLVDPGEAFERRWTRSANQLQVRRIPENLGPRQWLATSEARGVRAVAGALLLADLPPTTSDAVLRVGDVALETSWLDSAADPDMDPELGATWADDRPDAESPFEWFRWTLWSESRHERVPAPPGDGATQLLARHVADLWRAGLARVERRSEGVAAELRTWLVATSSDRVLGRDIASWIADPAELSSLLSILLDRGRDDDSVMRAALAWMDARRPLTVWMEEDLGGRSRFALANPFDSEKVVRVEWLGESEPPLATLIAPHAVERLTLDRPLQRAVQMTRQGDVPEAMVLALSSGSFSRRLALAPGYVAVRPPSLEFGVFVAPFSLAEAQSGRLVAIDPTWATTASLRRRAGRWELFTECFVPSGAPGDDDRVRIRVGAQEIAIASDGAVDGVFENGATLPPSEVGVRRFDDRWRMRIALPNTWLPARRVGGDGAGQSELLRIAIGRERGNDLRASAVLSAPALGIAPPAIEVDLSQWSD